MGYQKFSDAWRHAEIATADKPATLGALGALGGVGVENALSHATSRICPVGAPKPPKAPKAGPYARVLAALEIRCPDHIEPGRWQQAVEDGRSFLATWGERAVGFGWTARDLFGLAPVPDRPHPSYRRLSRYDETGLCWLLQGRPVVALTETAAAIMNPTGAITIFRRFNKPALGPEGDSLDDLR
jgi:hypothetical protein